MRELLEKYAKKLHVAGLSQAATPMEGGALLAGLDDELFWNIPPGETDARTAVLEPLFSRLAINSLVCTQPPPPYDGMLRHLGRQALKEGGGVIQPQDCETRTFLHDLPVIRHLDTESLAVALASRKGCVVLDPGTDGGGGPLVLAQGNVSPEQGFVTGSSICFACFVKFFADALRLARTEEPLPPEYAQALSQAIATLPPLAQEPPQLLQGPFEDAATVHQALVEAGRATVEHRLVDSYFGNISCLHEGVLYISQTGSSLDELAGHIDPCPLDGSSTAGLTASSELSAHQDALARTGARTMLHGHPPFCVIASLDCEHLQCPNQGRCHLDCSRSRDMQGTPIVPGEVGTGAHGLCHTLPPALESSGRAIVYGHGLFALGEHDFNQAFARLLEVERSCRQACLERLWRRFPEIRLGQGRICDL